MGKNPLVSIIIPTRNSAEHLDRCLRSIKSQSYRNLEIIVVDNNSDDTTKEIAKKHTKNVFNIGPERSTQRNYGVKKAKGDYVVIIDSDMVLSKTVIAQCERKILSGRSSDAQLIIPEKSEGVGFWANVKAFEREFYVGDESIEAPRFFVKEVFNLAGGYDERIRGGGEEYDLPDRVTKLGYTTGRIGSFITHLEGKLSLWETTKTKFYYGKTSFYYLRNHPRSASRKFNIFRPIYLKKWNKIVSHPILSSGMVIMKACEFSAGGIGLIKGYYEKHT